jgi:predicted metal-dependent phosphoesterase TrpH
MKADLHVHSSASDGRLSPTELIEAAACVGIDVLSLTDHDCVDGIEEALLAAERFPSMTVIPGVELSTDVPKGEIHVVGHFINYRDPDLLTTLERLRGARRTRAQRIVAKLGDMGLPLDWERVLQLAGSGAIGRPHIAQAMLERGHVTSLREAFDKYISREGPAYVTREKITPTEAVQLVVDAGGLPILAHPADIHPLEGLIPELQKAGLVGLESHYGGYTGKTTRYLASLCDKYGLIACGGSDYHGLDDAHEVPLGGVDVPPDSVRLLISMARDRSRSGSPSSGGQ